VRKLKFAFILNVPSSPTDRSTSDRN